MLDTSLALEAGLDGVSWPRLQVSFVEFQSIDLTKTPHAPLTVKAKLRVPKASVGATAAGTLPAVVILHGSTGVDCRGDFYADALNAAGIATLAPDMWEPRGVLGTVNRPQLPVVTYPDAFAALRFLSTHAAIDPARVGVLGFSWGGVMALGAAEQTYADKFGGGLRFAAHVANYPICYGANDARLFAPLSPAEAGTCFEHLTGSPVLIQIGTKDDYDNGARHCLELAQRMSSSGPIDVEVYPGAFHAWDRLQVPLTGPDPFGDEGSKLQTGTSPTVHLIADVEQAYRSRRRVLSFFSSTSPWARARTDFRQAAIAAG